MTFNPSPSAATPSIVPVELRDIPVTNIRTSPLNPRKRVFDAPEFSDLVDSVRMIGIQTPITVRQRTEPIEAKGGTDYNHYYEIIMGERRYRAALSAGLETVPALVRQGPTSDADLVELALVENLQRNDLNPVEEGAGFAKMLELSPNLTQADLGHRFGKGQAYISNAMRLLQLPQEVQELTGRGELPRAHAVALASLAKLPACVNIARRAVKENLTQKQVEEAVKIVNDTQKAKDQPALLDVPPAPVMDGFPSAEAFAEAHELSNTDPLETDDSDEYPADYFAKTGDEEIHQETPTAPALLAPPSLTEKVTTTETTKYETLTTAAAKPATTTVPTIAPVGISGADRQKAAAAFAATVPPVAPAPRSVSPSTSPDEAYDRSVGTTAKTSTYSAPNNAAVSTSKAPVLKTPFGDVDTSLCNDVLTSDALFVLVALNDNWNKAHAGDEDKQTTLAQRLEIIMLTRAEAAGLDSDELLEIKTKAEKEAGL